MRSTSPGPSFGPEDPLRHLDDPDVILVRLGEALTRCAEALAASPPDREAIGDWTVGDLSGHLEAMVDIYSKMAEGRSHPAGKLEDLGDFNDQMATQHGGDPVRTAEVMRGGADPLLARLRGRWGAESPWLSDIVITGREIAVLALGESLVHGADVAGRGGWSIDALDASILLAGIEPFAVHYVNEKEAAGLRAAIEVRIRGGIRRRFVFDGPSLEIVEPESGQRADCYISGDPTTFVLLMYGRGSPIAAGLRGKVLAWGRKPWLALKLPKLVRSP